MCCQQQAKSQLSYRDLKSSVQLKKKSTCLEILKQNSQGKSCLDQSIYSLGILSYKVKYRHIWLHKWIQKKPKKENLNGKFLKFQQHLFKERERERPLEATLECRFRLGCRDLQQ